MKKKILIVLGILSLIALFTSLSYAYFGYSETQNTFEELGSKCFELTMTKDEKGIIINKAHPVTDEEGLEQEGYQFTIKNTCTSTAYYQVNIEDLKIEEKTLSNQYIKASLNESKGKNINQYEKVATTIEGATESHKLTSGSLEPEEEKEYTLKLWMDYDTPAKEEVMNASYESKISIIASYIEEDKLENEITIEYKEPETYSKESEIVEITARSDNYKIIEYSIDGTTYEPVKKPDKEVTIEEEYQEEGTYPIYFKDEMGNIQEQNIETTKLDQSGPNIKVEERNNEAGAELSITFEDLKSGLKGYQIIDKETEKIIKEEEWESIEGKTATIPYQSDTNKTIIIKTIDQLENERETEYEITKADIEGPSIEVKSNHENDWTNEEVTITVTAEDAISDIGNFYYKKQTEEEWEEITNPRIEGKRGSASITLEETEETTYEFKVTDILNNESETKESIVKIDKENPEIINLNNPKEGEWSNSSVTITWEVKEEISGIQKREWSSNNKDWQEITENKIIFNTTQENTIYIKVIDNANNESTTQTKIKIDTTVPTITLNGTTKSSTWTSSSNNLTSALAPSSTISSYKYTWYQVPEYKYRYYRGFTVTEHQDANGSKYWNAQFTKSTGNTQDNYTIQFPNYSYTPGKTYRAHYKIKVNSVANTGIWVRNSNVSNDYGGKQQFNTINSKTNGWIEGSIDLTIPTEPYTVGSTTFQTNNFSPQIEIWTFNLAITDGQTKSIDFDFKDFWVEELNPGENSKIENNLAVKLSDTTPNKTFNSNTNSWYVVETTTGAGNKATSNKFQVNVDVSDPSQIFSPVNGTSGSNNWYKALSVKVTPSDVGSGVASAKYCIGTSSCNPSNDASLAADKTFTVSLGSNASAQMVCAQVKDNSGRSSQTTCSQAYKVDTVDPTASLSLSVANDTITANSSKSSDAHSQIAKREYKLDGGNWMSGSDTYNFTGVSDGTHTIYLKITDNSGRTKETNSTAEVISQNIYVSSGGNDTTGTGSSSKPFATIAKAYSKVKSGGTIYLLSNITQTATATFNTANKVVTLRSNGNTIYTVTRESSLKDSVLTVTTGNVTLTNITIDGNSVSATSPMIQITGGTLNLNSGSTVQNARNTTLNQGGGIAVLSGSTLNINGATITGNKSYNQGGGIYIVNNSKVYFNSGTISNNRLTASSGNRSGGGVYAWGGNFYMTGGTISNNYAPLGGGICVDNGSTLEVSAGTITGNSVNGIRVDGTNGNKCKVTLKRTVVSSNGVKVSTEASGSVTYT